MRNWSDFEKFNDVIDKYMPHMGEGQTKASQIATAVCNLVYKWFNDGDVYDNTESPMDGWCNDLSSYANWLAKNCAGAEEILDRIYDSYDEDDYVAILWDVSVKLLDPSYLEAMNNEPADGSIYKCDGHYKFVEPDDTIYDDDIWW